MPLSRKQKEDLAGSYGENFANANHAFVLGYRGISVPEVTELRNRVRSSGGKYVVVKNTLVRRAIEGADLEELLPHFEGPTAVAYSDDDPVALAKALSDFAEDVPAIEFKGGMVEGRTIAADEIKTLATMPSREELITKLVFLLQSPVTRFVRTLNAIPQQFVNVLHQVAQEKGSAPTDRTEQEEEE